MTEKNSSTKICTKCFIEKSLNEFSKRGDRPIGVVAHCKICKSEYAKQWNIRSKKHLQKYYLDNKESFRINGKKWRLNNKDRVNEQSRLRREANPELSRKYCEKWRRNNLDKDAKRAQDYRVKKINAKPKWANDKYISLWYKLAKIEEQRIGIKVDVDHIIPLRSKTVCGLHCEHNMQLLFSVENSRKGNRYTN